jgi:hypothetical protein
MEGKGHARLHGCNIGVIPEHFQYEQAGLTSNMERNTTDRNGLAGARCHRVAKGADGEWRVADGGSVEFLVMNY